MCTTCSIPNVNARNKLALVIGINDYEARNPLKNPENDARDMAAALRRINFNVEECPDPTYTNIEFSLKIFIESIQTDDIVLFYFAGHGQQWEDQNYLIPSDDGSIEGGTIKVYAFNVQEIMNRIGEKKPFVIIVILDCCRAYHLRHQYLQNVGRGPTDIPDSKGFNQIYVSSTTINCLIAFACAAGHIALDISSNGRNGLFTWHLLQHIEKPNQDIAMVLRDVALGVYHETKNNEIPQDPWINYSLKHRDIFLNSVPNLGSDLQSRENSVKENDINELNEKFDSQLNLKNIDTSAASAVENSNAGVISVVTEKNDTFISPYAKDYHTIKVLGKGSFGCVFEVVNKFDDRRLAVKRISLKNERRLQKARKEVQVLGRLDHPHVIRYFHTWIETPPTGWQEAQDDTYDWRDISRNERDTTTDSGAINTNTSTTASTTAGSIPFHTDRSSSGSYDLNYFLKMPSSVAKPSQKDASKIGSAAQESDRSEKTNKESQEPIEVGLVNLAVSTPVNHEDDQQISNEASFVQVKQDSMDVEKNITYLYYSMELCNDDTLERRLSPFSLTKEQTCDILRQIAETIAYIHKEKIIHGDIKPANIFFSTTNSIKIGDFGLVVEMLDSNQAVIEGRSAHGTDWYMAPELREKGQEIQFDEKVDIYAMGIVFLELLAPFKNGADRSVVLDKIRKFTKRKLDITPVFDSYEKVLDFNLEYKPIVTRLLNPLASERPSAKELLEDKSFLRVIRGIHVDKFLPSARLIHEIPLTTPKISHGHFACSEHLILLYESNTFVVFNTAGQVLSQLSWNQNDYNSFGFIACIIWSVYLNAFIVLSHRALFTFTYSNFRLVKQKHGAVFAPNRQHESRLRFITCESRNDYLFLNRGYHTIQQYKMTVWIRHREWTKNALSYSNVDEIRDITVDRNGEYLIMNVCKNSTTWVIDVRATDEGLRLINHIEGFHHKLQLFSPSNNYWLFVHGDPNRLYLYDIRGDDAQIPKEVLFGDKEDNPQFSFSKSAPINFCWLGNTHLVLGTIIDNNQSGVLKLYRI